MIETIEINDLPQEFMFSFEAPDMVIQVQRLFEAVGEQQIRWISNNAGSVSGFMMRMVALLMPGCFKPQSLLLILHFKAFAEDETHVGKPKANCSFLNNMSS